MSTALDHAQELGPYADFIVVNISSPNTPGLRALQSKDVCFTKYMPNAVVVL
jgi:dihydroorotate dehydrogenase